MMREILGGLKRWSLNVIVAGLWIYFACLNVNAYLHLGDFAFLLFTISQGEFALLVLARRPAKETTHAFSDYVIAGLGTFLVFFYSPTVVLGPLHVIGDVLIYAAALLDILGFVFLNRSAGIVPSNRGIKTAGPYGFVRHPIYLSSLLLYVGYVILSPSVLNGVILAAAAFFQVWRIRNEERLLGRDPEYVKYGEKVRWRLVPGVW